MFDPFWRDLIKKNQKVNHHFYPICKCDIYTDIFRLARKSNLIKLDQVWSILDGSDPKKSKTKQTFLFFLKTWQLCILTFFDICATIKKLSNLIKFDQVWSILDKSYPKKSKIKWPFLSFLKMWQLIILTFFDMSNH